MKKVQRKTSCIPLPCPVVRTRSFCFTPFPSHTSLSLQNLVETIPQPNPTPARMNAPKYAPSTIPSPATTTTTVNTADTSVRAAFLRKVYTLLTINFLITVGISCVFAFVVPIRTYVSNHSWLFWVPIAIAIAIFIPLACIRLKFPLNLLLMYAFVIAFSVAIGVIVARYFNDGGGVIVLQAFCATAAVFLAITAYIFITKKDFSFLYGFLSAAVVILIALLVVNFAFSWATGFSRPRWFYFVISLFGYVSDSSMVTTHATI